MTDRPMVCHHHHKDNFKRDQNKISGASESMSPSVSSVPTRHKIADEFEYNACSTIVRRINIYDFISRNSGTQLVWNDMGYAVLQHSTHRKNINNYFNNTLLYLL